MPAGALTTVFDDMEHGDPLGHGWFSFGGRVGGGGIDPNAVDLPPENGGAFSLQAGFGSGGAPGFFGGFERINLVDLPGVTHFSFWINPDAPAGTTRSRSTSRTTTTATNRPIRPGSRTMSSSSTVSSDRRARVPSLETDGSSYRSRSRASSTTIRF
jgi:hypothetical protein